MFIRSHRWWRSSFELFLFAVLIVLFRPVGARAFPEMVKHGYGNCISCHTSPTGGGILTPYGRELSKEVLSTWGREGEQQYVFGTTPEWFSLGGDLRTLNIRTESSAGKQDRLILMQADLEAALNYKKWTAVGTAGRLDTAVFPQGNSWISRRHYLMYRPADEYSIRAGRFNRAFGINTADHFTTVKDGLQWNPGTETYAIEGAWLHEKYNLIATADFGRPDDKKLNRENGASATGSLLLGEHSKVGASWFYGTNDIANRHVAGPWAILGLSSQIFLLSELDLQRNFAFDFVNPQWGLANYTRLDYEPIQGIHVFGTAEGSKLNFASSSSRLLRYGLGLQFFPRPHFEFEAAWQTQQSLAVSQNFRQILWLMFHYYL